MYVENLRNMWYACLNNMCVWIYAYFRQFDGKYLYQNPRGYLKYQFIFQISHIQKIQNNIVISDIVSKEIAKEFTISYLRRSMQVLIHEQIKKKGSTSIHKKLSMPELQFRLKLYKTSFDFTTLSPMHSFWWRLPPT